MHDVREDAWDLRKTVATVGVMNNWSMTDARVLRKEHAVLKTFYVSFASLYIVYVRYLLEHLFHESFNHFRSNFASPAGLDRL